jgi:hypothetical protein
MSLELKKATPIRLRSVGLDERWLQDRLYEDPSLIGLGDLQMIRRERIQPSGGRIDLLMYDPDSDVRFETEVMLGAVDESHIIRTIEYWDIERQRYPTFEHRAVIVAEEITSRFFNVIRLLNKAVPIIAVQLNAFQFEGSIVLHFTKVLDVYESVEEEDSGPDEPANRDYWEKKSNPASLSIADKVIALVPTDARAPQITYNRSHIAVGTSGYNFCWFHPRSSAPHCHIQIKIDPEAKDAILAKFEEAGISAGTAKSNLIKLKLVTKEVEENGPLIKEVLTSAEKSSRSRGLSE